MIENVNVSANAIDEQRRALQESRTGYKKFEFNEKNYLNVQLNPNETTRTVKIRILPVSATVSTPFLIVNTHSLKVDTAISQSGFKSFICLNDENLKSDESFSDGCPLCNKSKELFAQANVCTDPTEKKALIKAAMQYKSKQTFIVRVIERGHEDEGVKFWRFNAHNDGSGCYDQLMQIYDQRYQESVEAGDETPTNVFDLMNGKDFVLTLSRTQMDNGKAKTTIKIVDAGRTSPLSKDEEQAIAWVNDPKTWRDIYSAKSYDYLDVVAQGGIPVYSQVDGKYVARSEKKEAEDAAVAEAKSILENSMDVKASEIPVQNNPQPSDDDLPF